MTNKVETIVSAITTKLTTAGILSVIRFPEDLRKVGNRYPMAIIKEEQQRYIATAGQRYEYELYINIVLVSDAIRERMKTMNDLQVLVFNQLFADSTLGGLVLNINPVTVNMGSLKGSDIAAYAGFNEAASFREITIQCLVQDTRV